MTTRMESPAQGAPVTAPASRRVVDAPVRMCHALSALCFTGAWLTAESEAWRSLHMTLGYALAGLLVFRLLYGLMGPGPARLSLWQSRAGLLPDLLRKGRWWQPSPKQWIRQGQQGVMALLVLLLLFGIVPLTLTGYLSNHDAPEWVAEGHDLLGNLMLGLVLAHVGLVLLASLLRQQNLPWSMLTGRLPGRGPDLVTRNHHWLALLLLAAVLGFCAYDWLSASSATVGLSGPTHWNESTHHDESD
ncbi:cytochrome b/b6 domain-containing protein [Paludibacterium sp. B53371]|uniref:cytochrome b/b6 domain-containing protein n=1 Tax=Paludibacterium sp. B53371 TaxID=2806263 RepID=UPI001C042812|nr:cytochrome b/b6 domain-containing protein [Paludibacterium sp. B53371]